MRHSAGNYAILAVIKITHCIQLEPKFRFAGNISAYLDPNDFLAILTSPHKPDCAEPRKAPQSITAFTITYPKLIVPKQLSS